MTAATTASHAPSQAMILPPASDTYEVLGVLPGLKNFVVKYDADFIRGGDLLSAEAIVSLQSLGVRTVVSVTPTDLERDLTRQAGMRLVEMPFEKTTGPSPEALKMFVGLFDGGNTPVYVHCHGGTHRGGILGVAYRVHVLGWPWEKALLEYGYLGGSLKDDQPMLRAVRELPE